MKKQGFKKKVRASKAWKDLRKKIKDEQKTDPITGKPLTKMFNLHHLSQDDEYYDDLTENRFVGLNQKTHDFIHFCYNIYKRDKDFDFLERIKLYCEKMKELTENDRSR